MPKLPRKVLKSFFERGDRPRQEHFSSLIESSVNINDDRYLFGLRTYNPAVEYVTGDTIIYNNAIQQARETTTGPFNPAKWLKLLSMGSVSYQGTWNAQTNTPAITSGVGDAGVFYIVSVAGNTTIDTVSTWTVGDLIVFNGSIWQRVPNPSPVSSVNTKTGAVVLNTGDISESTNLYFTDSRADARITAQKGTANGLATLDSNSTLNVSQIPAQLIGNVHYQSNWNAATNMPPIPAAAPANKGAYYVVSTAGTTLISGNSDWKIGDWIVSNGTSWDKISNSQAVDSVNGQTGVVSLSTTDLAEGTNLYYTTARFDTAFATKNTSDLAEGSNLYFTNSRADARIDAQKGAANGIATLDNSSKIPLAQIPDSMMGAANYQSNWNAAANIPAIPAAAPTNKGWYYVISVPGNTPIDGINDWKLGDWIISNGTSWGKIDNTDAVLSVNGYIGAVVLNKTDLSLGNVENTALSTWPGSTNINTLGVINTGTWNADPIAASKGGTGLTAYTTGDLLVADSSTTLAPINAAATGNVLISNGAGASPSWGKVNLQNSVFNALPANNGGTGLNSYATGDMLFAGNVSTLNRLAAAPTGNVLLANGANTAPSWGKVDLQTTVNNTLPAANGGTGLNNYTTGDLVYAETSTSLNKLAAAASGNVLLANGTGTAPSWGKVNLQTTVNGSLPAANGGTGQTAYTTGDLLFASSATALGKLNAVATGNVLLANGTGTAPSWGKVDLQNSVNGSLPAANGGTGQTSYTTGDLLYASGATAVGKLTAAATGNVLIANGTGTAPSWGKVSLQNAVNGVLPVANGGTNSSATLGNNRLMISNNNSIIEHPPQSPGLVSFYDSNGLPSGSSALSWDNLNSRFWIGRSNTAAPDANSGYRLMIGDAGSAGGGHIYAVYNSASAYTATVGALANYNISGTEKRVAATLMGSSSGANNGFVDLQTMNAGTLGTALRITNDKKVGIANATPSANLDVNASAATGAAIRIRSGVAPTTPNAGDIWFDSNSIFQLRGNVQANGNLIHTGAHADKSYQLVTTGLVNGGSMTINNGVSTILFDQNFTLGSSSTYTLKFPASPIDGQLLTIASGLADFRNGMVYDGNGNTIVADNVPGTLHRGEFIKFMLAGTKWFRIG